MKGKGRRMRRGAGLLAALVVALAGVLGAATPALAASGGATQLATALGNGNATATGTTVELNSDDANLAKEAVFYVTEDTTLDLAGKKLTLNEQSALVVGQSTAGASVPTLTIMDSVGGGKVVKSAIATAQTAEGAGPVFRL